MGLIEQASRERRRPQFFPLSGAPRPTNRHMKIVGTFSGVSAREVREWDTKRSATDPWGQGAVGASSRNFGSTVESPSPNLPRPTRRTAKAAPPQSAEARRNLEGGRSGRTIDVHALRTTFGTLLSKGGVAPRAAQAGMRHSDIDRTFDGYTDPRLLDVQGALDVLPALPFDSGQSASRESLRATGTDTYRWSSARQRQSASSRSARSSRESPMRHLTTRFTTVSYCDFARVPVGRSGFAAGWGERSC
jgi:hypothetical protein